MVALIMLTMTIVASLNAVGQGRRLTEAAVETRQARALTDHLLATAPLLAPAGETRGHSDAFAWTVTIDEPVRAYGAAALCKRKVRVEGLESGRVYAASTAEICPNDDYAG